MGIEHPAYPLGEGKPDKVHLDRYVKADVEDGRFEVPEGIDADEVKDRLADVYAVDYDGDDVVVPDEEPQDLDEMNMDELKELYEELGGEEADEEDVHLGKKDSVRSGIERLRGDE
jgi:hypothetical protein